jgi:hypothetical protein
MEFSTINSEPEPPFFPVASRPAYHFPFRLLQARALAEHLIMPNIWLHDTFGIATNLLNIRLL